MMTGHTSSGKGVGSSNIDPYEPKGKCKKAVHRSFAIHSNIKETTSQLQKAEGKLCGIIDNISTTLGYLNDDLEPSETPENCETPEKCKHKEKARSMVKGVPKRIEFGFNHLKFYIDFTVVVSEGDDLANIKGSIVYGTSRTLCFSECIFPKKTNKCKKCERIDRCDGLEDKPLINFSVTQQGMIQSSAELEGEWWIGDKSNLLELHYRAMDLIWKQALDWANEIVLP